MERQDVVPVEMAVLARRREQEVDTEEDLLGLHAVDQNTIFEKVAVRRMVGRTSDISSYCHMLGSEIISCSVDKLVYSYSFAETHEDTFSDERPEFLAVYGSSYTRFNVEVLLRALWYSRYFVGVESSPTCSREAWR